MLRNFAIATIATLALTFAAPATAAAQSEDIVDTAVAAGSFKTLAKALEAADLVTTLKGAGLFTVFAPTDEAFAKLPAGTVEMLLKAENKAKLKRILTYHVVASKVMASDVTKMSSAKMVSGDTLSIAAHDGMVMADNVPGRQFCDEQVRGPFKLWRHTHRIEPVGEHKSLYEDRIEYALPGGRWVQRAIGPLLGPLLARAFALRHDVVRAAVTGA